MCNNNTIQECYDAQLSTKNMCLMYLSCVPLSLLSTDPGSHPGVLSAPACPGFFWTGGLRAEIHRPAGYRSHHQPHRPVTVHRSWKEVWRSLGNSCSVSGRCFTPVYCTKDLLNIYSCNKGHTVCSMCVSALIYR